MGFTSAIPAYIKAEAVETWKDLKTLDPKSPEFWVAANRIKNLAQGIFVLYGMTIVPNPDPSEYSLDAFYHLFDAALSKKSHWLLQTAALLTNPIRILDIGKHLDLGISTVLPHFLNYVDLASHNANLVSRTYTFIQSFLRAPVKAHSH